MARSRSASESHRNPEPGTTTVEGFVLTRDWRDTPSGIRLTFWIATDDRPVKLVMDSTQAVCFSAREDAGQIRQGLTALGIPASRWHSRDIDLLTPKGSPVTAWYFESQRELSALRERSDSAFGRTGPRLLETDIKPTDRHLMERFVTGGLVATGTMEDGILRNPRVRPSEYRPTLRTVSLDVESSGLDGDLYSIALVSDTDERVLLLDPSRARARSAPFAIDCFASEHDLLQGFLDWTAYHDPDVILGWNVIGFDLDYLAKRCARAGLDFALGRERGSSTVLPGRGGGQVPVARIPGRVALDGIEMLRAAFWSFEDFSLHAVSKALLGRGKLVHEGVDQVQAIQSLFASDKLKLAEYNIEDCRLVRDIFDKTNLVHFAVERANITGLSMGRVGGSVAAFDHLYLPRLHRAGRVATDPGALEPGQRTASPGGYVLDSKPGLYRNVLVLDFKSLYPSIIRTFMIDPYGLWAPGDDPVEGFLGAAFARERGVLPTIMTELWERRDQAKRDANSPLSQAIKIIMNACYGVLASTGCRFFDPRLATSITRRGHEIINRSREFIENAGHTVIYGDTDSLFVLLPGSPDEAQANEVGRALAKSLNAWWTATLAREHRLTSHLEVEFETHYLRFLMPTVRGSDAGTKKRYAGSVRTADGDIDLVFKGLESVRTDWTPLARNFQRELYRRVFCDLPYRDFVEETDHRLRSGALDHELVYRKRMRRAVNEYKHNVPPHVQAAAKLEKPGRWISYIITHDGPEPVANAPVRPDYEHYRTRQLAPAADSLLRFLDTSYANITDKQLAIF